VGGDVGHRPLLLLLLLLLLVLLGLLQRWVMLLGLTQQAPV
jgi:hypothetical protein